MKKINNELLDDVRLEIIRSFTRNGLAMFGFDGLGMVLLQAAQAVGESELPKESVGERSYGDGELVVRELFENWSVGQLTTRVGLKKIIGSIVGTMLLPAYADSLVYVGSTKVQIIPSGNNIAKINLIYVRERNV